MKIRTFIITLLSLCALHSGAQTLTATYVELADSADRYIRQERWADAERVIVKALRHEPANKSNYLLWSNLGVARTEMKNYDGALEAYEIGLAMAPASTALLSNRARTYMAKGDKKEAVADLDKALSLDSTLQWPRKMRGLVRASAGDSEGALSDFRIYINRFGKDAAISEACGDIDVAKGELPAASTTPASRRWRMISPKESGRIHATACYTSCGPCLTKPNFRIRQWSRICKWQKISE